MTGIRPNPDVRAPGPSRAPGVTTRQATLAAWFGPKPGDLHRLIRRLQDEVGQLGDGVFVPYGVRQVHATLFGLARTVGLRNRNFAELRGIEAEMDLDGLRTYLLESDVLPLHLRFGGFRAGEVPFRSRGEPPFERTFSIQGDKAVLVGWPTTADGRKTSDALDRLRREAQDHGVLHRYHARPEDVDNDAYLRLGLLRADVGADPCREVEEAVRRLLADAPALHVEIDARDLSFVTYTDETLPLGTSRVWPLPDPGAVAGVLADLDERP
jgi:hypothetical protein